MYYYKRICYILIILILATASGSRLYGNEISTSEIKASWIYTVIDWISWKNRPKNQEYTICTIGRDKVHLYLKNIKRSNKNNKLFTVKNKDPEDNFSECYILYISNSEQEYYTDILAKANNGNDKGIVTISDIDGFARRGGMIEFVIKKKARLIINLKTANNANVSMDDEFYGWSETIY